MIRHFMQVRIRDDKDPEQATSAEQVADMYRAQAVHTSKHKAKVADDEDWDPALPQLLQCSVPQFYAL